MAVAEEFMSDVHDGRSRAVGKVRGGSIMIFTTATWVQGLRENPSTRNLLVGYVSGEFEMSPGLVGQPKHAKSTCWIPFWDFSRSCYE